ncbi:M4 family metallopeptidase [Streptomyces sp. NPDC048489]|uniref:M4 family metallopeptidase n=1 Tax=Streptomyces sp. NPDC048489 TaxID=3154504 RepID=UPI00341C524C
METKLVATDVMIDTSGKRHVRFTQTYRGIPVLGADLVVHLSASSRYLGVTRSAARPVSLRTVSARLTSAQAKTAAADAVKGTALSARLVVSNQNGKSVLAYQVPVNLVESNAAQARNVTVDAQTGDIIENASAIDDFISPQVMRKLHAQGEHARLAARTATSPGKPSSSAAVFPAPAIGTGRSLFSGTVTLNTTQTASTNYTLIDTTRGRAEIRDAKHTTPADSRIFTAASAMSDRDNVWGNSSTSDNATAAVDAAYGLNSTFDFYKSTFNRNGIKNDGVGPHGVVHYDTGYGNAAWVDACSCMIYGDGDGQTFTKPLVQLDVTGHELTHGVVAATAGLESDVDPVTLEQFGEPGSLNESLADIFGSAVEFKASSSVHAPNYLVGEQLGLTQGFLRRLDRPSLDKLEGAVDYWSTAASRTEVHAGSGVSSHAFYLLAEGSGSKTINGVTYNSPTFDGSAVTGIGRDAAVAIFYQALTRYMVPTTDFHDARAATLQAAVDLYGSGSAQFNAVNRAWAAVNVTASNG